MFHRMSKAGRVWHLTREYYSVLNEDDDFRRELAHLVDRLEALGVALSSRIWDEAECGDPDEMEERARRGAGSPEGRYYELAVALRREVGDFIARWPLPRSMWRDLRYTYDLALMEPGDARGRVPRLQPGGFAEFVPTPGFPLRGGPSGERNQPWILPSHPLPFLYDPLVRDRAWLDEQIGALLKEIRESILAQARLYEEDVQAQGWVRRPARWNAATVRKAMERLYLRTAKRLSWPQIAYRTSCSEALAKRQVKAYARLLGVPLPERHSP